jgi:hypothetical protein
MNRKPNFTDLGFSTIMGSKLRKYVEEQLLNDAKHYGINSEHLMFDWSESCIEGKDADYLDGSLENFSSIYLYDDENLVAEGWMEFILDEKLFVYWDILNVWDNDKGKYEERKTFGIPKHINPQVS